MFCVDEYLCVATEKTMTAEWLHLPHPYPPGVGPLCGAELEAWYEDLQDILGSDAGGAKLARHATAAPPPPAYSEKEPEFLDVLESCSLTWLTEGGHAWGEVAGAQRVTEEPADEGPATQPPHHHHHHHNHHHHTSPASSSPASSSPASADEGERARKVSGGGDLLPPEFFELLSEGGVGMVETGSATISGYHHNHRANLQPGSPASASEEEEALCVPGSPSSSSNSSSQSPSHLCSPPSSPVSSPTLYPTPNRLGKRKRSGAPSSLSSGGSHHSSSSSAKKSRKEREQENERKVQELTDQNERLKAEIERLGEEVQRTRRALIERLVNTRK